MHIPDLRPYCYTDGPATPRAAWAFDQGRGCGNAGEPDFWERNLQHTPGCAGCSRARHALDIGSGVVDPLPAIKSGQ